MSKYEWKYICVEHQWQSDIAPCRRCGEAQVGGRVLSVADVVSTIAVADATKEGRKIGKVRMDLVMQDMPRAIEALARVMTWALDEKGYKESDWLHVPDAIDKYHGGLHRHDNKEMRGQEFDDESNMEHAIHTAWNAMARVELILRKKEAQ